MEGSLSRMIDTSETLEPSKEDILSVRLFTYYLPYYTNI